MKSLALALGKFKTAVCHYDKEEDLSPGSDASSAKRHVSFEWLHPFVIPRFVGSSVGTLRRRYQ